MVFLKILTMMVLGIIAYQDIKSRMVVWVLFPVLAILLCLTHFMNSIPEMALWSSITNMLLVSLVLMMLFLYTKLIAKKRFLNVSFGLGDIFFLYAISFGFPTVTFVVLFLSAILFSLLLFLFVKKSMADIRTVPLAGFMSLFLMAIVLIGLFPKTPNLYVL